jgi:hypothetical protein
MQGICSKAYSSMVFGLFAWRLTQSENVSSEYLNHTMLSQGT